MKSTLTTITIHVPDDMPREHAMRLMQATVTEIQDRERKEREFQEEVRRRGLDRGGLISSLLGI